jgi:dsRNA-specific ribonuclease
MKEKALREHLEKIEVLSDIYLDLLKQKYPTKAEKDIAKLKMQLVKKEMLLLNYIITQDIGSLSVK